MLIEFVGDICAIGNRCLKNKNSIKEASDSILVVNLEQSLETDDRADKSTVVSEVYQTIELIKSYDINVICNANNHAHDSKESGFLKLKEVCEKLEVNLLGIGQTQDEALKATLLHDDVYIIAACQFNFPTLTNVKLADGKFGVAELNVKKINEAIDELPSNANVVIFVHWGVEHIPIPHPTVRELAKELSINKKVKLIIGSHPHLVQPKDILNGCQVFYSIGNFMFPNFVISPPTQINNNLNNLDCDFETYSYHKVLKPTYKRWPLFNRISQKIIYNPKDGNVECVYYKQSLNENNVDKLGGFSTFLFKSYLLLWGATMKLPAGIYAPLFIILRQYIRVKRSSYIALQYLKQGGVKWFLVRLKQSLF